MDYGPREGKGEKGKGGTGLRGGLASAVRAAFCFLVFRNAIPVFSFSGLPPGSRPIRFQSYFPFSPFPFSLSQSSVQCKPFPPYSFPVRHDAIR